MNPGPAVILILLALDLASAFAAQSDHHALAQRHIEARGGISTLQGLKVIERIGSLTVHGATPEIQGTYHTCVQYPDRVAVDVNAGPVQVHQVLGDFGALECDATFTTCSPAQESVAEELRKTARVANREELDESIPEGVSVEPILQATTQVGYRYRKDRRTVAEEFSPETGLLRRRRNGERERFYSDWRSIGGKDGKGEVLLPMRIEDFQDGKRSVTTVLTSATHTDSPSEWCSKRFSARPAEVRGEGSPQKRQEKAPPQEKSSLKQKARQAEALFKQRNYPEAAALARQVFLQEPDSRASDKLRILLCQARSIGADVGDPAAVYPPTPQPLPPNAQPGRPRKIAGDRPQLSESTRRAGQEGVVIVSAMIDEDGCLQEVKVQKGVNPFADQDALRALPSWVFVPSLLNGNPVRVYYSMTVGIHLSLP